MFQVTPGTVQSLFDAQKPRLQRELRLDLSSSIFPPDLRKNYDVSSASVAVGERVLRVLADMADDAVMDRPAKRVLVLKSHQFVKPARKGLNEVFGLDPTREVYRHAISMLAEELYRWALEDPSAKSEYHVKVDDRRDRLYVMCDPPYSEDEFSDLDPADSDIDGDRAGLIRAEEDAQNPRDDPPADGSSFRRGLSDEHEKNG